MTINFIPQENRGLSTEYRPGQLTLLEFAKDYLARGFSVIPLVEQEKKPAIAWKEYQTNAPTQEQVEKWFPPGSHRGVGIVTGCISGIVVLDFDSPEAFQHGKRLGLPPTPMVRTKRGFHCYFQIPQGMEIPNFQGRKDLPEIDLRGDGGYVVAPPSLFSDGMGQYRWIEGHSLEDIPMASLPEWVNEKSKKTPSTMSDVLHGVSEGRRNSALCHLVGIACHKGHTMKEIYDLAKLWNVQNLPPLPENELFRTISSIHKRHQRTSHQQKKTINEIGSIEWGEPEEPGHSLLPVPPLDINCLPPAARSYLIDIAERMQVPIDYPAVTAVITLATIIGTRCAIAPKKLDSWVVSVNLWGGLIGQPGQLKTPTMDEVIGCLKHLENSSLAEYSTSILKYEAEMELHAAERKKLVSEVRKNISGILKDEFRRRLEELSEPLAPTPKRYLVNDATPEKLLEILADNEQGVLVFRDELVGLFSNWSRPGREAERSFFLEAWSGRGRFTTDRICRGSKTAKRICISLIGSIQPDRLHRYLCETFDGGNDGLLQRFQLLVYPDRAPVWNNVDRLPNILAKDRFVAIVKKLDKIDFRQTNLPVEVIDDTTCLRFSEEAQSKFDRWLEDLENNKIRNDSEPEAILEHLSKYRSLIPSLALIYHLSDFAEGSTTGPVSAYALSAAIKLGNHLEAHARRIYGMRRHGENSPANRLAKHLRAGKLSDPFTTRDLYKANLHLLNTREMAQSAIDELIELGWLQPIHTPTSFGQKGKTEYAINPKIFQK